MKGERVAVALSETRVTEWRSSRPGGGDGLVAGADGADGALVTPEVVAAVAAGRHRRHRFPARGHVLKVLYADEERAAVQVAADLPGFGPAAMWRLRRWSWRSASRSQTRRRTGERAERRGAGCRCRCRRWRTANCWPSYGTNVTTPCNGNDADKDG